MSSLILDLQDHLSLSSLRLRLSADQPNQSLSGELQLFGMDQQQLRLVGQRSFANIQNAKLGVCLTGTVARGLILRVQGSRDDQPDKVGSLVVEELWVERSPDHETLSSASRPL